MRTERELQQRREAQRRYRLRHPDRLALSAPKRRETSRDWYLNNLETATVNNKKRYQQNKEVYASRYRKSRYGISQEQFEAMVASQENKCAICGTVFEKTPHVDHNHETGENRDLLCRFCNLVLGNARDSIQTLLNAVEYLKRHGAVNGKAQAPVQSHSD